MTNDRWNHDCFLVPFDKHPMSQSDVTNKRSANCLNCTNHIEELTLQGGVHLPSFGANEPQVV